MSKGRLTGTRATVDDLFAGQEMGYSVTQVAMRAGHDPSIAAKHYSGCVSETDRALAEALASLIAPQAIG